MVTTKQLLMKSAGMVTFWCTQHPPYCHRPAKEIGKCVSPLEMHLIGWSFANLNMLSSLKEYLPNKLVLLSLSKKNVSGWHGEWRLWNVDFHTWVLRGVLFKKFAIFSFSSFSPLFYLSERLSGQNMSIPELFELLKMTPSTRPDNYVKPQYRQQWKLMTWQSIDRSAQNDKLSEHVM